MMVTRSMRKPGDGTGNVRGGPLGRVHPKCGGPTAEDRVCGDVQGLVAFGEHCAQGQDQDGVNGESVAQVLLQQNPLQEEPGGTRAAFQKRSKRPTEQLSSTHQMTMQTVTEMSTPVLTSGSATPILYLNTMPRPTKAFTRVHQTKAASPFWV